MANNMHTSTEANKATNRRYYEEIINQQKLAVVDEVTATGYVNHDLPMAGQDGLKHFVGAFHTAFSDGHMTIDQMIAEGNMVATRLTFRGTHTGEFQGVAPTGQKVTMPALDMARYEDGKIAEQWGGPDQVSLKQQLEALPKMTQHKA